MPLETILPASLGPETPEEIELVDDMTVTHVPAQARGATQRVSFGDPRWRIRRRYKVRDSDRAKLMTLLQIAQGKLATLRTGPGNQQRGSFATTELFTNAAFANSISGWTPGAVSGTPGFTAADGVARLTRTSVSSGYQITQVIATVTSAAYLARGFFLPQGDEQSGATYNALLVSTIGYPPVATYPGLASAVRIATTTSMTAGLISPPQGVAGSFFEIGYASAQRCGIVGSGTWAGAGVNVACMPSSTEKVWRAGDYIEINGELKQLTAPVNTDANGVGYAAFRPGLFRAPSSGDAVVYAQPLGRFTVSDIRWSNLFGLQSDVELTLDEVYE